MRFSVAVENYDWQHQDVRTENGIEYGDTIDNMDFAYLEKVTKLNVAALAALASAPPPPEPKVEGAVSTDTTVTWAVGDGRCRAMSFDGAGPTLTNGQRSAQRIANAWHLCSSLTTQLTGAQLTSFAGIVLRIAAASASTIGCSASRR